MQQQGVRTLPRISTDLDDVFLDQLRVLVARQRTAPTPREKVAFSLATFSVYLDCLDLGLEAEAQALLEQGLNDVGAVGAA